jgi:hypothetical protein
MRFTAQAIAAGLRIMGIPVESFTEGNDFEDMDGEIRLNARQHVQVGYDYLMLVEETDDHKYMFSESLDNIDQLIDLIRQKEQNAQAQN